MARKSLKDMSGIASTIARSGAPATDKPARTGAPALGALQGALGAIREIDPAMIDDWGPVDRMDEFTTVNPEDDDDSFEALKESIQQGGQQVPILLRRAGNEGRFQAIYGRRRLKACRELGIKVRANVQDIDDATALLAKGLENAARRNLSFYEKARFAEAIQAAGHDGLTARRVLNLSASGLSHLTKVTQNVPAAVGNALGAAPKSGRPKWTALAELFAAHKLSEDAALEILAEARPTLASDERLDRLLKVVAGRSAAKGAAAEENVILTGVAVKSGPAALVVTVKKSGESAGFAAWLEDHLGDILQSAHAEFTAVNSAD
ncbi:plasmid partitioning protein RepB [Pseudosulfitobacter sp. DSM 107133]|jgi:ParB family chromosome partitioning protein|uniref:plasmid partitioning protein RepB n=1 Tax=Pseudosulfitobacter sp. DSM 107133 TaxID=2883100 RepID=UPI000DF47F2E|nr:plasmid partitioning protein RepB [Pseudosulfitobacter sp. DSM 107133]UOA28888.1 plasmid partitioning protein RepB-4 [Pseudosulfitobacter sp. DSM 107133]